MDVLLYYHPLINLYITSPPETTNSLLEINYLQNIVVNVHACFFITVDKMHIKDIPCNFI